MEYDFHTLPERRNTGSSKYEEMLRRKPNAGENAVPLSVADMEFLNPPEVIGGLKEYLNEAVLGYTGPTEAYFQAVIGWMSRRHGFTPKKEWILPIAGIVPALYTLVRALTKEGEGVIMTPPVYHPFRFAVLEQGRQAVFCPLIKRERTYDIDFPAFEKLCEKPEIKVFLLCSPHNPVGRIWTREELVRLSDICLRNNVVLVADEIHGDLILPGYSFVSVGTLEEKYLENTVLCTAPSKTFNLAGLQTSNLIVPGEALRQRLKDNGRYPSLNCFGYQACFLAYDRGEKWLDALLLELGKNKKLAEDYIKKNIPEIQVGELMGTYLLWLDMRALGLTKEELEKAMLEEDLFFDEGYIFGEEGAGFERVNIACPGWVLLETLQRLKAAADKVKGL